MKICIYTDSFLPYCSGVTFAVINQTRELVRRGHEVMIFRPAARKLTSEESIELPSSVEVHDVPLSFPAPTISDLRVAVPTFFSTYRRVRQFRPDVIHVNTEWGCGWEGLFAARLLGVPLVGTFHTFFADPGYLKNFGVPNLKFISRLIWAYAVTFYNRCDVVTSPSAAVREALVSHGLKHDPVLVSNGIQMPALRSDADIETLKGELKVKLPTFVYVGRIAPEKSMEVLLKAFQEVLQRGVAAQLIIVGDGPSRTAMEQQIDALGIRESVNSLGFIPHEELITRNLPRAAIAFVTASNTENQPISILEAMSFGLPIIGPRAKGIPELVEHGESGLLFEPDDFQGLADCMIQLLNDDELRRRLAGGSLAAAMTHSMESVAERLEAVYHQAGVRE